MGTERYFPGNENTPQETLDRPGWAKGVALTADAREPTPHRGRDRKWLRGKFQAATPAVYDRLLELLQDEDGKVAIAAARMLAEYGWGKPEQMMPEGAQAPVRASDPEALRANIVAVLAAPVPAERPGPRGVVIDARPALPAERG